MIEYIHHRLCRWSVWVARGNRIHGLGFPSSCAYTRLTPRGQRPDIDFNDDAFEIDRAIASMDAESVRFLRMFYTEPGTVTAKAAKMGCHRDTLYARLHQAQVRIMEWLQDHADEYESMQLKKIA